MIGNVGKRENCKLGLQKKIRESEKGILTIEVDQKIKECRYYKRMKSAKQKGEFDKTYQKRMTVDRSKVKESK